MSSIDDDRTIRCGWMAMKQKDRGYVVRNGEPGKIFDRKSHCQRVTQRVTVIFASVIDEFYLLADASL